MSAAAPNRAVSATVLLALVVTGGCLALASAVPIANGRRLQQFATSSGDLTSQQLLALTSGLQKLSGQLQNQLQIAGLLPSDLQGQLQFEKLIAGLLASADPLLQLVSNLLFLGQSQAASGLLTKLATIMDALSKQFQNPQPAGGCFEDLQASLEAAISDLTSQLKSTTAGLPVRPLALIAALNNLRDAVGGQVNPCAPGLENLLSNGQVHATIREMVVAIRSTAEQKP